MLLAALNTAKKQSVSSSLSTGVTQMGGSADMRHLASPAWVPVLCRAKDDKKRVVHLFGFLFLPILLHIWECCAMMSS